MGVGNPKDKQMTLQRFLMYVRFSRECPADIFPPRWNAMLRWLELNPQ